MITTPYADDFNLITRNKVQHQKIIKDLEKFATSMGLIFKPVKCRSLNSIKSGKPIPIVFKIGDSDIISVKDDTQIFLGSRNNL